MTKEEIRKFLGNTKVYVNGKSKEIQEKLFTFGYKWNFDNSTEIKYTDKPFLFIYKYAGITWADSMRHFVENKNREISADEILSLEMIEPSYRPFNTIYDQVRMELLVDTAQKFLDYLRGDESKKQESAKERLEDGVYLIDAKGNALRFKGVNTESVNDTAYIGIVQGNHSVAIALHDVSKYEITLTKKVYKEDHGGHIDNYMDAVQDWDGKWNTEMLNRIGLNPAIQLKDGEYIPTLAELYLICLNQKDINEAMRFVGGQELAGWYWSSTEFSATNAWYLGLESGYAGSNTKTTNTHRVRLVSAFLQNA